MSSGSGQGMREHWFKAFPIFCKWTYHLWGCGKSNISIIITPEMLAAA
jgi:hypothetical protein